VLWNQLDGVGATGGRGEGEKAGRVAHGCVDESSGWGGVGEVMA
jgi:hypothetical protein